MPRVLSVTSVPSFRPTDRSFPPRNTRGPCVAPTRRRPPRCGPPTRASAAMPGNAAAPGTSPGSATPPRGAAGIARRGPPRAQNPSTVTRLVSKMCLKFQLSRHNSFVSTENNVFLASPDVRIKPKLQKFRPRGSHFWNRAHREATLATEPGSRNPRKTWSSSRPTPCFLTRAAGRSLCEGAHRKRHHPQRVGEGTPLRSAHPHTRSQACGWATPPARSLNTQPPLVAHLGLPSSTRGHGRV